MDFKPYSCIFRLDLAQILIHEAPKNVLQSNLPFWYDPLQRIRIDHFLFHDCHDLLRAWRIRILHWPFYLYSAPCIPGDRAHPDSHRNVATVKENKKRG